MKRPPEDTCRDASAELNDDDEEEGGGGGDMGHSTSSCQRINEQVEGGGERTGRGQ